MPLPLEQLLYRQLILNVCTQITLPGKLSYG